MFIQKFFRPRNIVAIVLVLLLMVVAYAYAAANIVPATGAGDGANTISGYDVSAVTYALDATDPGLISGVSFTIMPTAGAGAVREVKVQLVNGGAWFDCNEAGAPAITCAVTGVTVLSADQFRVVAVQ